MDTRESTIFRPAAARRQRGHRAVAAARPVGGAGAGRLWLLLLGIGLVSLAFAWSARVPVYAAGLAAAELDPARSAPAGDGRLALVVFLPPERLDDLQVGRRLALWLDADGPPVSGAIAAVEPTIPGPAAARRAALAAGGEATMRRPVAVVLDSPGSSPTAPPAPLADRAYRIEIEVGSRRLLAVLPLVGSLFGA